MIVRRHIFHRYLIRPSYKKHRVEQWEIDLAEGRFKTFTNTKDLFRDLDENEIRERDALALIIIILVCSSFFFFIWLSVVLKGAGF